jgi:hypothetical protein
VSSPLSLGITAKAMSKNVMPWNQSLTPPSVVLMDELDQLLTAKQDVVYNFFNWPTMCDSQMFVIAVANRMDLPQHLAAKIKSRLGERGVASAPTDDRRHAASSCGCMVVMSKKHLAETLFLSRSANAVIPTLRPDEPHRDCSVTAYSPSEEQRRT